MASSIYLYRQHTKKWPLRTLIPEDAEHMKTPPNCQNIYNGKEMEDIYSIKEANKWQIIKRTGEVHQFSSLPPSFFY